MRRISQNTNAHETTTPTETEMMFFYYSRLRISEVLNSEISFAREIPPHNSETTINSELPLGTDPFTNAGSLL